MSRPETSPPGLHEDPVAFREAVTATAAATGFAARLVEKDYFCAVLLQALAPSDHGLVFKGGTCLAKVHAVFYRLSEDLDFAISMPIEASRSKRSRQARCLTEMLARAEPRLSGVRVVRPLQGANNSTQYTALFGYRSVLLASDETIQLEVGLREPLLTPSVDGPVQTLLFDPISESRLMPPFFVRCLSLAETMAEKLRAALSRRQVAIRDFYDIDYAVRRLGVRLDDPDLLGLVRSKLAVPGNEAVFVSRDRLDALRWQVAAELQPVLRSSDYREFDLDRAFAAVRQVADALGSAQ